MEPTSGEVIFESLNLTRLFATELRLARRQIGMVFQEFNLVERLSVMENLLCGRLGFLSPFKAWLRRYPPRDIARAFELLDTSGSPPRTGARRQPVGRAAPARRHRARA